MEAFLPYLLILVGWNPASPTDSMEVAQSLQPSREACEAQGAAFMAGLGREADKVAAQHRYFCVEAPSPADYDALIGRGQ
ncbi:MAG: hypothetical protein E6R09_18385 [Rhodocyclaceae bacterium]|nr:MAG: hypothetical protein E6R09_18385 [Rhodocyclaceae bacterium]